MIILMNYDKAIFLWENPQLQELNRLPSRSPLLPFGQVSKAIENAVAGPEYRKLEDNNWYQNLNGTWKFVFSTNPGDAVSSVIPEKADDIKVPGTWTRQGWDKPHYTNVQMPFPELPPKTPKENPTGFYYKNLTLPPEWKNRRIVLHVGSAESLLMVYINGELVGLGKDTRLPSEFDITSYVSSEKEICLCLKVIRYSDASFIEDQDQWWFGGIHRSVYLYSTDFEYIQDICALPQPKGELPIKITLGGDLKGGTGIGNGAIQGKENSKFTVKYQVYPFSFPSNSQDVSSFLQKNKPILTTTQEFTCNYRLNSHIIENTLHIPNPTLWSHENPALYIIGIELLRDNRVIETTAFTTGFRKIEIAERELRINDKAVYIKGVNRHEHDQDTGKTLSVENMLKDIMLLKQYNFNAVRTCHYPDDEDWYELCDRYGIYLTDEANIENHCFYDQLCRDERWSYGYLQRVQRMVQRDKNHVSVIIWSLGNESGDGENQVLCNAWVRRYDPTRAVHYEGFIRPEKGQGDFTLDSLARGKGLTDIIGPMYPSIELITDYVKERDDYRPLIMCEYSHAMGNSNGSLADYWKAIEKYPGLQGGYIWDWIDQGLTAHSSTGEKYWKYGGDFGDTPTDFDFCLNGLLFPDQTTKPAMEECKQVFSPIGFKTVQGNPWSFVIENKMDFTPLNLFYAKWSIYNNENLLYEGIEKLPEILPGEKTQLQIVPDRKFQLSAYSGITYIHFDFCLAKDCIWAKKDFRISSAQSILRETLINKERHLSKEKILNFLESLSPCLFRVPTENDGLKNYFNQEGKPESAFYWANKAYIPWIELDLLHLETKVLENYKTEEFLFYKCIELSAGKNALPQYKGKKLGELIIRVPNTKKEQEPVKVDLIFDIDPSIPALPRIGVETIISHTFESITWIGEGPQETYPDRKTGAFLGTYKHSIPELYVPYIVPQENGNRMGTRFLCIESKTEKMQIISENPIHFSASCFTPENMLKATHTYQLKNTLKEKEYWTLHLDVAQRGVGTATCGPDTRPEYWVQGGLYKATLYIG